MFRFIRNITKKEDKNLLPYISADELEEAKLLWLRVNQLAILKNLENSLRLRLDDRSTGSLLPYSTKKPILLNRNHEFWTLTRQ